MPDLVTTGAQIRWYTRSVERRYDEEPAEWATNADYRQEEGSRISLQFGAKNGLDTDAPFVRIRVIVYFEEPEFSAEVDGGVEFQISPASVVEGDTIEQATEFLASIGIPYLLGIERGVLADMTRQVGLPTAMLPPLVPQAMIDDIRKSMLRNDSFV